MLITIENPNSQENLLKRIEKAQFDINWHIKKIDELQINLELFPEDSNILWDLNFQKKELAKYLNLARVLKERLQALNNDCKTVCLALIADETEETVTRFLQ